LVIPKVSEGTLQADLERYRQKALELGASAAEVIPASWVVVDERVRLKCFIPRCPNWGESYSCPPYTPEAELIRQALSRYTWALLFKHEVIPVEEFAELDIFEKEGQKHLRKTAEIAAKIETLAFADGYYLAMGFGSGGCKTTFCGGTFCQVLDSGRCRFPLKARPSMEAMCIDAFGLAARVRWEIYPIYAGVDPQLVPCALSMGIVFIY
jgi:predicted metal-binding protein